MTDYSSKETLVKAVKVAAAAGALAALGAFANYLDGQQAVQLTVFAGVARALQNVVGFFLHEWGILQ